MNWQQILTYVLIFVVAIALAALLRQFLVLLGIKAKEAEVGRAQAEWLYARDILADLIMAAVQLGSIGAGPTNGAEKKKWVVESAEALLSKAGVKIELDGIAALIEAVYVERLGAPLGRLLADDWAYDNRKPDEPPCPEPEIAPVP